MARLVTSRGDIVMGAKVDRPPGRGKSGFEIMGKTVLSAIMAAAILAPAWVTTALAPSALAQEDAAPTPQSISTELYQTAMRHANAGDYETARRLLEANLQIKPGQVAYLRLLTLLAVLNDRPDDAFAALDRVADQGLTLGLERFEEALRAADAARFDALIARFAENAAPVGRAERLAVVDAPDALIEGVAMDIEMDRLFLSSVAEREILMIEPFSPDEVTVFADADDGLWSVFGIGVDDRTRMLWASSGVLPQTPMAEGEEVGTGLFAFDLVSGDLHRKYEIEGAERMTDFVVRDGAVYVSDNGAPRVYVLDDLSSNLRVLVEDDRFTSLQGLALSRGALYVADYTIGIWRIDLGDQSVSLVEAGEHSLVGIDGLLNTRDGRLVAVRNGVTPHQVMAIDLDREGRAVANVDVLLRAHRDMGDNTEPTLIDLADGRAWLVANAAWPLFPGDGSAPEAPRPSTVILEMNMP